MAREIRVKINGGTVALSLAALVLTGSVAVAVTRQRGAPAESAASAAASVDPLTRLERGARDHPRDVAAWEALGQSYYDAGRYANAVDAYVRATNIDQAQAALWSALGEARVMASPHEPMPAEAAADFTRALAIDPHEPRARYFAAVRRDLTGDHAGAIKDWLALLADTPPGSSWENGLRRTIQQVGKINNIPVDAQLAAVKQPASAPGFPMAAVASAASTNDAMLQGIPGPTPEQLRAASSIPPSQQDEMAKGMVAQLEARLKSQPNDVNGWAMMIRSRMMLNQPDQAAAALTAAIAANPGSERALREQAAVLGVR